MLETRTTCERHKLVGGWINRIVPAPWLTLAVVGPASFHLSFLSGVGEKQRPNRFHLEKNLLLTACGEIHSVIQQGARNYI